MKHLSYTSETFYPNRFSRSYSKEGSSNNYKYICEGPTYWVEIDNNKNKEPVSQIKDIKDFFEILKKLEDFLEEHDSYLEDLITIIGNLKKPEFRKFAKFLNLIG